MSQFISICDLIAHVKAKLPKDTPIPSEATVLYFAPPNMFSKSLILINSTLGALDHDVNQKEVLPHTLSLLCKVLHSIDGLFYRGTPIVTLKD